jgi:hypothetical protein
MPGDLRVASALFRQSQQFFHTPAAGVCDSIKNTRHFYFQFKFRLFSIIFYEVLVYIKAFAKTRFTHITIKFSLRIIVRAVYSLIGILRLMIPLIVVFFETITFLGNTKMNIAPFALRVGSRFQENFLLFPSDHLSSFTLALTPFTPSSSFQEDRYVNADISEAHLVSRAQSTFPSLIFKFSTGMDCPL